MSSLEDTENHVVWQTFEVVGDISLETIKHDDCIQVHEK